MNEAAFFRFPHTPHLAWLGSGEPRDEKVLSAKEAAALLAGDVVVEEKLDGANLGLSLDAEGRLRAQNRGQYLVEPHVGQFARLPQWLALHGEAVSAELKPQWILFGEWCAARHSLAYDLLPDWWLVFDLYDRERGLFLPTAQRDALAARAGLTVVPQLLRDRTTLGSLKSLVIETPSRCRSGGAPMEGLVIRRESDDLLSGRAKLVRPDFTQAIGEHWRKRRIEWNRLAPDAGS